MDPTLLKAIGQVAGIGGIGIGVLLIIFREIIRKNVFPQLSQRQAYRTLTLIIILTFSAAAIGVAAWVFVSVKQNHVFSSLPANIEFEETLNFKGDAIFLIPKNWDIHMPRSTKLAIAQHPADARIICQSAKRYEGEFDEPFPSSLLAAAEVVLGTPEKDTKILEHALGTVAIEQLNDDRSQGVEKQARFYPLISALRIVAETRYDEGEPVGRAIKIAMSEHEGSYSWIECSAPLPEFRSLRKVFDQVIGSWRLTETASTD